MGTRVRKRNSVTKGARRRIRQNLSHQGIGKLIRGRYWIDTHLPELVYKAKPWLQKAGTSP